MTPPHPKWSVRQSRPSACKGKGRLLRKVSLNDQCVCTATAHSFIPLPRGARRLPCPVLGERSEPGPSSFPDEERWTPMSSKPAHPFKLLQVLRSQCVWRRREGEQRGVCIVTERPRGLSGAVGGGAGQANKRNSRDSMVTLPNEASRCQGPHGCGCLCSG